MRRMSRVPCALYSQFMGKLSRDVSECNKLIFGNRFCRRLPFQANWIRNVAGEKRTSWTVTKLTIADSELPTGVDGTKIIWKSITSVTRSPQQAFNLPSNIIFLIAHSTRHRQLNWSSDSITSDNNWIGLGHEVMMKSKRNNKSAALYTSVNGKPKHLVSGQFMLWHCL